MAKKLSLIFGIVFLVVGILGFIPNPIVGQEALFHADAAHNIVHLIFGIILTIIGAKSASKAGVALKISGVIYLILAIVGFISLGASGQTGDLLGLVSANSADNWLHLILGIALLGAGLAGKGDNASAQAAPTMNV
jgi:hypothetical protein